MLNKLLGALLGAPAEAVADYFKERQRLKSELKLKKLEGKVRVEEAKAQMEVRKLEADNAWELAHIANSGWKDEWVLILLSIPLILVFIPSMAPYIQTGFEILDTTPQWYRYLIIMVFAAVYGIRVWRRGDKPKILASSE
jgi:hypothetical protein